MSKTLIHTALLCEAQTLINFYKLKQILSVQNSNFKLFVNDQIILIVSGIGKNNTQNALEYVFENFDMNEINKANEISKAVNIGIAGCSDSSIKVGTLFCTNKLLPNINFGSLTTLDEPLECDENLETLLVDMEAKYFLQICKQHIKDVTVLKVVSDHLDVEIPKKAFVIELIKNTFNQWKNIL